MQLLLLLLWRHLELFQVPMVRQLQVLLRRLLLVRCCVCCGVAAAIACQGLLYWRAAATAAKIDHWHRGHRPIRGRALHKDWDAAAT
jgi:hypothetical protein